MSTISLVGLPVSRTDGWPPNTKQKAITTTEEREPLEGLSNAWIRQSIDELCGVHSKEYLLRGVFAPPMDIEPIEGPID